MVPKGRAALLVIEGLLVAPAEQIFEVPDADPFRDGAVGHVLLHGDRVRCVYPEWWGGGGGVASTDTAALQNAVRVALSRSTPLPVELLGRYIVERPIVLSPSSITASYFRSGSGRGDADESNGVELRGRVHPTEATIRCSDTFVGDAILAVDPQASAVTLRMVSLDARGKAPACVSFALTPSDPGQVTRTAHVVRHCALRGATVTLLLVTRSDAGISPGLVVSRVPMLEVIACTFSTTQGTVGARLAGPRGAVVDFRGCTFAGEALAMIHVLGQGVVATSCRFDNRQVPEKLRGAFPLWDELHRAAPDGGLDVLIDFSPDVAPPVSSPRLPLPMAVIENPPLAREIVVVDPFGTAGNSIVPRGSPGWISAQDCRSSSLQFLATSRQHPLSPSTGARDSVVIGLHHACDPTPLGLARNLLPPAIQWWIAPTTGCTLTLMGCRFDGLSHMLSPRVKVVGMNADDAARPPLFEYGTCSADRVIRTPTDGTTPNSDVFSAADPGRVPYR